MIKEKQRFIEAIRIYYGLSSNQTVDNSRLIRKLNKIRYYHINLMQIVLMMEDPFYFRQSIITKQIEKLLGDSLDYDYSSFHKIKIHRFKFLQKCLELLITDYKNKDHVSAIVLSKLYTTGLIGEIDLEKSNKILDELNEPMDLDLFELVNYFKLTIKVKIFIKTIKSKTLIDELVQFEQLLSIIKSDLGVYSVFYVKLITGMISFKPNFITQFQNDVSNVGTLLNDFVDEPCFKRYLSKNALKYQQTIMNVQNLQYSVYKIPDNLLSKLTYRAMIFMRSYCTYCINNQSNNFMANQVLNCIKLFHIHGDRSLLSLSAKIYGYGLNVEIDVKYALNLLDSMNSNRSDLILLRADIYFRNKMYHDAKKLYKTLNSLKGEQRESVLVKLMTINIFHSVSKITSFEVEGYVYTLKRMSSSEACLLLADIYHLFYFYKEKEIKSLYVKACEKNDNAEALYRLGLVELRSDKDYGLKLIEQSSIKGHNLATVFLEIFKS